MAIETSDATTIMEIAPRVSEFRRFTRVFFKRWVVVVGLTILLLVVIAAIFAPWIAPYDPYKIATGRSLEQPSAKHWLGTDRIGRDNLSRVIYGSRTALEVGFITVAIASIAGIALGMLAGFAGGWFYTIIMRAVDTLMCFPGLILFMFLSAILGNGVRNVIIALSIGTIAQYVRVMCGLTLSLKQNDYIMAEMASGAGNLRIMLRHILPNAFPPLIVLMTMQLGTLILAEAALGFLGMGIVPPMAAWGSMVNESYVYLQTNPWLCFAPGICIFLVVFSFNMVGDGLRDALDPRLRGLL
ncbi:MAG: ABC transporter permease [Dehalococcoidales bacterium]|jgi:ABC-type dipeptide/oligopeptide/nickel transport system permease subunit